MARAPHQCVTFSSTRTPLALYFLPLSTPVDHLPLSHTSRTHIMRVLVPFPLSHLVSQLPTCVFHFSSMSVSSCLRVPPNHSHHPCSFTPHLPHDWNPHFPSHRYVAASFHMVASVGGSLSVYTSHLNYPLSLASTSTFHVLGQHPMRIPVAQFKSASNMFPRCRS
jgi:hypothetical protein